LPTVLLIRHAQASFGASSYDLLSELGHRQAAELGRALARRRIVPDQVVSGSLSRQLDTARASRQPQAAIDARWNEYDADLVLAHHSTSTARLEHAPDEPCRVVKPAEFQLALDEALRRWLEAGAASDCPETWPEFLSRINEALSDVTAPLGRGQTALVFSSGGVIAAVAAALINAPAEAFVALNRVAVNTAITKIAVGTRGRTLISYNDHSHLDEADSRLVTYR
jgi:broad specificity phosphatase PhoE